METNKNFIDTEDFIDYIVNVNDHKKEYESLDIVCKYDIASKLINELVRYGFDIYDVSISNPELNGYFDEYVISLSEYGIFCEELKRDTGYISLIDGTAYVNIDCNPNCTENFESNVITFAIDEFNLCNSEESNEKDDERDFDCKTCDLKFECDSKNNTYLNGIKNKIDKYINDINEAYDLNKKNKELENTESENTKKDKANISNKNVNRDNSCLDYYKSENNRKLHFRKDENDNSIHGYNYSYESNGSKYDQSFYSSNSFSSDMVNRIVSMFNMD